MTARLDSLWADRSASKHRLYRLDRDIRTDVCVIGAGIAGLTVARCLREAGHDVVLLDRRGVGAGETGRSSAHVSFALDDRLCALEDQHGEEGARRAVESHRAAVDLIERWSGEAAGFARVDGYLLRAPSSAQDLLEREADAARRLGVEVHADRVPALRIDGGRALRFPDQARIDPLAYLRGLEHAVRDGGGRLFRAQAISVEDGDPCRVITSEGPHVDCRAVVVCTNVPFHRRVAYHTKQAPYRSFLLAFEAPRDLLPDALFWDTGDPYHYLRWTGDAGGADLLLIGGADHKVGQREPEQAPFRELEAWARAHLLGLGALRRSWSGQIIEPVDGLAYIGRDIGARNVFVVTGDSGNGLTHGTLAGPLIASLVGGEDHPWRSVYDPARKQFGREWIKENANVAWQYHDWVAPAEGGRTEDLARDEGRVLRRGLRLCAVHRDGHGQLHAFSARCPHLGCVVRWNRAERSWDCPCHGSRFEAANGTVLNGPAATGLEPIDPATFGEHDPSE